jgi:protein TonB
MRAAYVPSSYANRPTLGSRTTSFVISAALVALLIWMLIHLGLLPDTLPNGRPGTLTTINVQGDRPSHAGARAIKAATKRATAPPTVTKVTPPPTTPPPKVPPPPIPWIHMSHDDFVQSDIATTPSRSAESAAAGQGEEGAGSGAGAGDDNGAGGGQQGDRLYKADWYPRPPTQAEMDFYTKHTAHVEGWGEIACRTVPRWGVEDCRPLGETPGSGFARAMVDASWQFHVMPPRVNGKPMVGTWVRIHFDFTLRSDPDTSATP